MGNSLKALSEVRAVAPEQEGAAAPAEIGALVPAYSLVLAAGRDPETVRFETEVVSFFIQAADMLGVPKSVAAIYGVCFASAEPLSFQDVEQRLDISRGSISQGLRVLREVGALRVVAGGRTSAVPFVSADDVSPALIRSLAGGDPKRRDFYEPDLKLRNLASRWIEQRLQKQLDSGRTRLQGIAKSIPEEKGAPSKVLRDRLKTLQAWHDQTRALLPLMKTFLKL